MKIRKGIPIIDQHDKNYMYGGKFGGNFIPETLKKPVEDLTILFEKLVIINNSRYLLFQFNIQVFKFLQLIFRKI